LDEPPIASLRLGAEDEGFDDEELDDEELDDEELDDEPPDVLLLLPDGMSDGMISRSREVSPPTGEPLPPQADSREIASTRTSAIAVTFFILMFLLCRIRFLPV